MATNLEYFNSDAAPRAIGPYSQAVAAGKVVFLSGQIPLDPATGELVIGSFAAQVDRVLANLDAVLRAAECTRANVAKATVYLVDLGMFGELNARYAHFFGEHRPARAVVEVKALPKGAQVEIEAVAVK